MVPVLAGISPSSAVLVIRISSHQPVPSVVTAEVTLEQAGQKEPYLMTIETRNGYVRF